MRCGTRCRSLPRLSRREIHSSSLHRPTHPNFFSAKLPQSQARRFNSRPFLLLTSCSVLRPQLPFLHPHAFARSRPTFASGLARFTTETKARWKASLRRQIRIFGILAPALAMIVLFSQGMKQAQIEHMFPTPQEWSFWSRWHLRTGKYLSEEDQKLVPRIRTPWETAGMSFATLLKRLEDEAGDGKDLVKSETLVESIGRTGFDISMKSEPWRRGYFQALMCAAKCAENLDGMAKIKGSKGDKLIPWESIPGPQNPRPKPMAWQKDGRHLNIPSEEACESAYSSPESFYMKILTTNGFDNGQRLSAALAYADWCDFKELHDTAGSMYDWALDIAAGGLPMGADGVVDIKTGVINTGKDDFVTQNLLTATTALGVHHARNGEVKEALPIFLSILRARKSLPAKSMRATDANQAVDQQEGLMMRILKACYGMLGDPTYPSQPPSGDERPIHTPKAACEEVALMTYIGEILFSTSVNEREKGLSWTRDSVGAAEAVMWVMDEQHEEDGRDTCRECLETGLKNWKVMTTQMMKLAAQKEQEAEKNSGWFGLGLGKGRQIEAAKKEVTRWREETQQVQLRIEKTLPLMLA